jgi:hypothetical protein
LHGYQSIDNSGASDERLKRELRHVGVSGSGVPLYEWRYKEGFSTTLGLDPTVQYRGTTAQGLLSIGRADAVVSLSSSSSINRATGGLAASAASVVGEEQQLLERLVGAGYMLVDYAAIDVSLEELPVI